jgi:hypothetical protein
MDTSLIRAAALTSLLGAPLLACSGSSTAAPSDSRVWSVACPFTTTQSARAAQWQAHEVMAVLASGTIAAIPADYRCDSFRSGMQELESDIADGSVSLDNGGTGTTCGLQSSFFRLSGMNAAIAAKVASASDSCYGPGTSAFVNARNNADPNNYVMYLDPGALLLTQNLGGTDGAWANGTEDGDQVTVYEWPTTCRPNAPAYGAPSGGFKGGEPCSPVALNVGAQTSDVIACGSAGNCASDKCMCLE